MGRYDHQLLKSGKVECVLKKCQSLGRSDHQTLENFSLFSAGNLHLNSPKVSLCLEIFT